MITPQRRFGATRPAGSQVEPASRRALKPSSRSPCACHQSCKIGGGDRLQGITLESRDPSQLAAGVFMAGGRRNQSQVAALRALAQHAGHFEAAHVRQTELTSLPCKGGACSLRMLTRGDCHGGVPPAIVRPRIQGPPGPGAGTSAEARGPLAPHAPVTLAAPAGTSARADFPQNCFNLSRNRFQPVSCNGIDMFVSSVELRGCPNRTSSSVRWHA